MKKKRTITIDVGHDRPVFTDAVINAYIKKKERMAKAEARKKSLALPVMQKSA
ncbi:MAG: hypothetical protein NTX50_29565 [Candidatus Sumerlaeota bacterium]|nr:hypothetical protein [Candidatus Sumerlaeota bacterium]